MSLCRVEWRYQTETHIKVTILSKELFQSHPVARLFVYFSYKTVANHCETFRYVNTTV